MPFIHEMLPEGSNPSFQCPVLLVRHGTSYVLLSYVKDSRATASILIGNIVNTINVPCGFSPPKYDSGGGWCRAFLLSHPQMASPIIQC